MTTIRVHRSRMIESSSFLRCGSHFGKSHEDYLRLKTVLSTAFLTDQGSCAKGMKNPPPNSSKVPGILKNQEDS